MTGGNLLHATCVAIGGKGVLIIGPSGSGKSDLALRLIDRGAMLVADDYGHAVRQGDRVMFHAPATIAGLIEVRGLGVIRLPWRSPVALDLVVQLRDDPARLPLPGTTHMIEGCAIPMIEVNARAASAALVVEYALAQSDHDGAQG